MGIATTKSFADIDEGTQVVVEIDNATYDEEGRFGPAVELTLDVLKPSVHAGETILSTFSLSQPRRSKVRDLRADGFDDEAIAEVLKKKGYEFETIDDPETPRLGGALLRIAKAIKNEDRREIKKFLEECQTFDALADGMVGGRFVATTRRDNNDYTRIDGKKEKLLARVMPGVLEEEPEAYHRTAPANGSSANEPGAKKQVDDPDWEDIPF
jgi:hypothetical protein